LGKRANGILVFLIGVFFIIAGIAVMFITVSGVMDQALHLEFLPAFQRYIIGTIISALLIVIGIVILIFGSR
jgi:ABC-type uncharacterized transport system fused permease/ATPase subunit